MSNLKDLAIDLAVANLVADVVAERKDSLRHQMAEKFAEMGSDSVKVTIDDDRIGKISLVEPKTKAIVDNEVALMFWVRDNHAGEIVSEIRESFRKYLLDNVEILEDGSAVLKTTGEIVPGITGRRTAPYVSTRFESDGREKLGRAIANGKIAFALPTMTKEIEESDE
jgi:hypothetical protein